MTPPQPPSQTLRERIQTVIEALRDKSSDLFADAASWRNAADMTGPPTNGELTADAIDNEEQAAFLTERADELEAALAAQETSPLPDLARAEGFRAGWRTAEENVHPMMAWGEPELDWDIDLESALAAYLASGNCTRSRCRCLRKPLLGRISRGNLKRHGISEMV